MPKEGTSKDQLKFIADKCASFLMIIYNHSFRHRGKYSFLGGIGATLAIIYVIIWYGVLEYPMPWKIIDPSKSGYKRESFRFADYESAQKLGHVLRALFPPGTPKDEVENILELRAQGEGTRFQCPPAIKDCEIKYYYTYRNVRSILLDKFNPHVRSINGPHEWRVAVTYNKNSLVQNIKALSP